MAFEILCSWDRSTVSESEAGRNVSDDFTYVYMHVCGGQRSALSIFLISPHLLCEADPGAY